LIVFFPLLSFASVCPTHFSLKFGDSSLLAWVMLLDTLPLEYPQPCPPGTSLLSLATRFPALADHPFRFSGKFISRQTPFSPLPWICCLIHPFAPPSLVNNLFSREPQTFILFHGGREHLGPPLLLAMCASTRKTPPQVHQAVPLVFGRDPPLSSDPSPHNGMTGLFPDDPPVLPKPKIHL